MSNPFELMIPQNSYKETFLVNYSNQSVNLSETKNNISAEDSNENPFSRLIPNSYKEADFNQEEILQTAKNFGSEVQSIVNALKDGLDEAFPDERANIVLGELIKNTENLNKAVNGLGNTKVVLGYMGSVIGSIIEFGNICDSIYDLKNGESGGLKKFADSSLRLTKELGGIDIVSSSVSKLFSSVSGLSKMSKFFSKILPGISLFIDAEDGWGKGEEYAKERGYIKGDGSDRDKAMTYAARGGGAVGGAVGGAFGASGGAYLGGLLGTLLGGGIASGITGPLGAFLGGFLGSYFGNDLGAIAGSEIACSVTDGAYSQNNNVHTYDKTKEMAIDLKRLQNNEMTYAEFAEKYRIQD